MDKLNKADEIIGFLKQHPGYVLQFCRGVRGNNWWWVRDAKTCSTVNCNSNAAKSASKKLLRVLMADWRTTNYILP